MSSGGWWDPPRLLMEGNKASRIAAQTSWSWRWSELRSLEAEEQRFVIQGSKAQLEKWKQVQGLPTQEDGAVSRTLLEPEGLQQEASSAGPCTRERQTEVGGAEADSSWNPLHTHTHTHHAEVERPAEVHLLQQLQQPALHLLRLEQQTGDGLDRRAHTQKVQEGQESQVLLGQEVL